VIDTAHMPIDKWDLAPKVSAIGADFAHVWRASLDQPADVKPAFAGLHPLFHQRFLTGTGGIGNDPLRFAYLSPNQNFRDQNSILA
jgi:hypothetical protein